MATLLFLVHSLYGRGEQHIQGDAEQNGPPILIHAGLLAAPVSNEGRQQHGAYVVHGSPHRWQRTTLLPLGGRHDRTA